MKPIISIFAISILFVGCGPKIPLKEIPLTPAIDFCADLEKNFHQIDKFKGGQITVQNGIVEGKKIFKKTIGFDQKYPIRIILDPLEDKQYKHIGIELFFRMDASNFPAENLPVKSFSYTINILDDNECRRINQNLYECYISEKIMADSCSGGIREVKGYEIFWDAEFSVKARSIYHLDESVINQNVSAPSDKSNCKLTLNGNWSDYTGGQKFHCDFEVY